MITINTAQVKVRLIPLNLWVTLEVSAPEVIVVVENQFGEWHTGMSRCSLFDQWDIRVGVPLALKRALRKFKGVNRPLALRLFFKQWPEAHPNYMWPRYHGYIVTSIREGDCITINSPEVEDASSGRS